MLNIQIHDNDAETLINAFESVYTLGEIDLSDDPALRFALANLIGLLRTQASIEKLSPSQGIHKRVILQRLMTDKFKEWEAEYKEGDRARSADNTLADLLDTAGLLSHCFVTGSGASSSIASFLAAFEEHPQAAYEAQLCSYTDEELEALSLADIAHSLILE